MKVSLIRSSLSANWKPPPRIFTRPRNRSSWRKGDYVQTNDEFAIFFLLFLLFQRNIIQRERERERECDPNTLTFVRIILYKFCMKFHRGVLAALSLIIQSTFFSSFFHFHPLFDKWQSHCPLNCVQRLTRPRANARTNAFETGKIVGNSSYRDRLDNRCISDQIFNRSINRTSAGEFLYAAVPIPSE